jgi:hypothetical protein
MGVAEGAIEEPPQPGTVVINKPNRMAVVKRRHGVALESDERFDALNIFRFFRPYR